MSNLYVFDNGIGGTAPDIAVPLLTNALCMNQTELIDHAGLDSVVP
jgi:hypothetical protein